MTLGQICCQHARVSPLPSARAVSMGWLRDHQSAPGQRALASPRHRVSAHPLVRLEPTAAPTSLHTVSASAMGGCRGQSSHFHRPGWESRAPFSGTTGALSTHLGTTTRSQCPASYGWSGDDQTVRHPARRCHFTRPGDSLNLASISFLLGRADFSERSLFASFLGSVTFRTSSTFSTLPLPVSLASSTCHAQASLTFARRLKDTFLNNLVAHPVGSAGLAC